MHTCRGNTDTRLCATSHICILLLCELNSSYVWFSQVNVRTTGVKVSHSTQQMRSPHSLCPHLYLILWGERITQWDGKVTAFHFNRNWLHKIWSWKDGNNEVGPNYEDLLFRMKWGMNSPLHHWPPPSSFLFPSPQTDLDYVNNVAETMRKKWVTLNLLPGEDVGGGVCVWGSLLLYHCYQLAVLCLLLFEVVLSHSCSF